MSLYDECVAVNSAEKNRIYALITDCLWFKMIERFKANDDFSINWYRNHTVPKEYIRYIPGWAIAQGFAVRYNDSDSDDYKEYIISLNNECEYETNEQKRNSLECLIENLSDEQVDKFLRYARVHLV